MLCEVNNDLPEEKDQPCVIFYHVILRQSDIKWIEFLLFVSQDLTSSSLQQHNYY